MIEELCSPWVKPQKLDFDSQQDLFLDLHFSMKGSNYAIANSNLGSTPGLDGIDYNMVRNLPEGDRRLLLELYNQVFELQSFPVEWRKYSIFFYTKRRRK